MLAGCDDLLPDQAAEALDRIVPGITHTEDLANLDFDARIGNVDVLSYLSIEKRFLPATEVRREHIPL